ncbi:IPT/TIG domain-containing protein [Streptomyces sp. SAJ15]|uniref:IPT/TIG domain-containing protein n=1 Tax=Streptomyces sp. SAJ15 TaxID=2011095 RepID=UPI00135E8DCF|nr:IPT/TIG domain-containing protein [Streptomyces sp. SAJ15]TVL91300.1 DNA-binding protein [Streptomyces sp. SAJ15]
MSKAETASARPLPMPATAAAANGSARLADPSPIPVGPSPVSIAFTPDGTRAYVTNSGGDTVSVIDTATNTVTGTVTVGAAPWGVAIHPDGTRAYVTNSTAGTVSVINTTTNTVIATITVGGTRAYVTNSTAGTVSLINTTTNTVIATITVGTSPHGVAVTPDGTRAYVANSGTTTVSVIDTTTNTATRINTATSPAFLAASPDGSLVYATMTAAGTVTVINPSTDTITRTIPGFSGAQGISPTPDGRHLYVVNNATSAVRVLRRPAAISPNQGSLGGGTPVTIIGHGFTNTSSVHFGTHEATDVVVVNDTTITAVTPAGTGSVTVRVTAAGGTAVIGRFYYRLLPVIDSTSVSSGPMSGGSLLTITGRRFIGVKQVWFKNVAVVPTILSDTQMTVVVPPSALARTVPIHTANRGGVSNSSSYTYLGGPAITSISPISGSRTGSRAVNINGTSLAQVTSVTFAGNPAITFKATSDIKIQAITPPGTPGPAAVVVRTASGATATSPIPYTYT